MAHLDFISALHTKSKRDYRQRVIEHDKAKCAEVAKKFAFDYWDGERCFGYGGYRYDGRWEVVARNLIDHYGLNNGSSILDVGCGKAFLLYELKKLLPDSRVCGLDISTYALENARPEIRESLCEGKAQGLPFDNQSFDFVYSITTLHNLYLPDLFSALKEIQRVAWKNSYVVVESYRNETEKANLLYWQLTCESFFTPEEWEFVFDLCGYSGDYSFIYFE